MAFSFEIVLLQSTAQLVQRIWPKRSILLQENNIREVKNTVLYLSFSTNGPSFIGCFRHAEDTSWSVLQCLHGCLVIRFHHPGGASSAYMQSQMQSLHIAWGCESLTVFLVRWPRTSFWEQKQLGLCDFRLLTSQEKIINNSNLNQIHLIYQIHLDP